MTILNQIYKCNVCGNMIEVTHIGDGELVCCGEAMELQLERDDEEKYEKHKPVVEKIDGGVIVSVGSMPHPMESEHYIEWIEVITEHRTYRKRLGPGKTPEAEFFFEAEHFEVRSYCNLHGLWKA
ncbi:MAG: Desulfoferrodoxin [uncultured bacterium]|nr:MAG: Desulfoferrodoxin [uncultured bacterium]HCU70154.1 desulfoferrodoxin [Candidatus Moranbacteria bacterium]